MFRGNRTAVADMARPVDEAKSMANRNDWTGVHPPELLTVADFCKLYSIGRTSLYREVNAGRLKLRKFGSATRITRTDAEAWAASLPEFSGEAA